jgi:copper transport protein
MKPRWFSGILLGLLLILALSGSALAHATLTQSLPLQDAVLSTPPPRVELQFNEEVEAQFGAIAVYDQKGTRVDKGDAALDPKDVTRVIANLKPLDDGLYTVAYRVVSADGHPITGSYGFSVGQGAAGAQYYKPDLPDPSGTPPFGVLAGYWLATGGMMILAGIGVTRAAVVGMAPDRRYLSWAWGALAAALAGTVFYLIARTAQAAGISMATAMSPTLLGRMLTTKTGLAVLARLILLAVAAFLMPRMGRLWWFTAAVGALGLLTLSMGGHAIAVQRPVVGVVLDWLHLLAAGIWAGGVIHMALLLPRGVTRGQLADMVKKFSPLAALCVAVLIGTGLYPTLLHIPSMKALEQTAYGGTLIVKLLLILPLLMLGAFNLIIVGPRLRQGEAVAGWLRWAAAGEVALMALVVGAAVLLTNLPPARVALPPEVLDVGIHTQNYAAELKMSPLLPGYRTVDTVIESHEGSPMAPDTRVELELVLQEHDMGHNVTEGKFLGDGKYRFDNVLVGMPGHWDFIVRVAPPGGAKTEEIKYTVTVPELP